MKKIILILFTVGFLTSCNLNPSKEARIQKLEAEIQKMALKIEEIETRVQVVEVANEKLQNKIHLLENDK